MKKTLRSILALSLVFMLLFSTFPAVQAATGDEIRSAKKIISVVFDDSGSMTPDSWTYASYAMQALASLLNEQDELYMTYMSIPDTSVKVDLTNIQGAVQKIRDWSGAGSTPFESVKTAAKVLSNVSEADPSTQFWLFVMTDGGFNELASVQELEKSMKQYAGKKMSNGSAMNVAYLAMGGFAMTLSTNPSGGLHAFHAKSANEIADVISDVSNLISGRITADDVKKIDDKTYTFSSKLPLYSISVLSQQVSAAVTDAASSEMKLNVNRNVGLDAYYPFETQAVDSIVGNAAVISHTDNSGKRAVIPADTYTITFSEPVDLSQLTIQYEPAIGMDMVITKDGIVVQDTGTLAVGDEVTIELIPVVPGTTDPIDPATLPAGMTLQIEYVVDGTTADSDTGGKLTGVDIQPGDNMVRGTMQIPGFAPSVYEIEFPIEQFIYDLGIVTDQPDPLTYNRRSGNSKEGTDVVFRITNEGTVLDAQTRKDMDVTLKIADVSCDNSGVSGIFKWLGRMPASCKLEENPDGSFTLKPNPALPGFVCFMMAGEYTVTVATDRDPSITATGTFTMEAQMSDLPDLIISIGILLLILYLILIFTKTKFRNTTVNKEVYKLMQNGRGVQQAGQFDSINLGPFTGLFPNPFKRASEKKFSDVVLRAGPEGSITIVGSSIAEAVEYYGKSSKDPVSSLGSIISNMKSTEKKAGKNKNRSVRFANDQVLSQANPVYFRDTEASRNIWRIREEN